ncbi:MAG: hypothetical protein FWE24_02325 [Defluviitaleaceae bacterium]|nr:hypothetical protein [Defluviitaleaceae bacterium]
MKKEQKKVICIKADENKDYEQIIFIMKNETKANAMKEKGRLNFVMEAEKIINTKYDDGNIYRGQKNAVLEKGDSVNRLIIKQSSPFDIVLNVAMMAGCIFLIGALLFLL